MSSYFKSVKKALYKVYGPNVKLYKSNRADKKFMIYSPTGKKIHFGQKGYSDYHLHKNPKRRENFKRRNAKWANAEMYTPAHLSYYILW